MQRWNSIRSKVIRPVATHGIARCAAWCGLVLSGVAAFATTPPTRLQETTEAWRRTRATAVPIETYLRPLIGADAGFNPDPGIALASLSPAMQREYDGLQYLLNSTLRAQFLVLSSDSLREEWLRRYWRLRDPTPTTPENERRDEHARRVQHARAEFTLAEPPGWDARGQVYIAFGEPDSVIRTEDDVRMGLGYVAALQDWLYFAEGWIAQFERPTPKGAWLLGKSSATLSYRPDVVSEDRARLGYTAASDPTMPDLSGSLPSARERESDNIGEQDERILLEQSDPDRALPAAVSTHEIRTDLRAKELLGKRRESVQSFSQAIESGGERFLLAGPDVRPFWYVFDVDVFKGPPGRMRVELHYQFSLQDLEFRWRDPIYVARYRIEGVLLDRNVREAANDAYTETLKADEFRSTFATQLIPGQLTFTVPPGEYRLAIRFVDEHSDSEGVFTTDVSVPVVDAATLALSDVEMATKIVHAGDDWRSRFVKHNRLVIPNPIGIYRRDNIVNGYFEIYGLRPDPENVSRFSVQYSIVPRSRITDEGWFPSSEPAGKPFVASSFNAFGVGTDLVQELRIDVTGLEQDTYELVLTVTDLISGAAATSRTAFSILD